MTVTQANLDNYIYAKEAYAISARHEKLREIVINSLNDIFNSIKDTANEGYYYMLYDLENKDKSVEEEIIDFLVKSDYTVECTHNKDITTLKIIWKMESEYCVGD